MEEHNKKIFTLLDVAKSIKRVLSERNQNAFWVKAEMNKLNHYAHSGHCYPDLLEKKDGVVVAQMRANLWKDDYFRINNNFLQILKEPLKDGIKILFLTKISFDPVHGLALNIIDIDPAFTLGDLEKDKRETIKKLQDENIFNRNKLLKLPLLPQRIAIISVETSKGYADFLKIIDNNLWGYKFFHQLFPSLLQGERAIESIIGQLKRIKKVQKHFDVVAIVRGGGGDVGLSCYNNYVLAKAIVEFPIPVITGIGHATNLTVVEMVAFENAITPTKIGEFLLQKFHDFSVPVQQAKDKIIQAAGRMLFDEKGKLQSEIKLFRSASRNMLVVNRNEIKKYSVSLLIQSQFIFKNFTELINSSSIALKRGLILFSANKKKELLNMDRNIKNLDPGNILKRGFSITRLNGNVLLDSNQVVPGEKIVTILFNGEIESSVILTKNKEKNG